MADLVSKSKTSDVEFNVETVCRKHEKVACFVFFYNLWFSGNADSSLFSTCISFNLNVCCSTGSAQACY